MIDLHCHSRASDGSHAPEDVVAMAAGAGVECLALTDHDTVSGLESARNAASGHGIKLIPGIEISAAWESRTLHIVGLDIDPDHPDLVQLTRRAATTRIERAHAMADSLATAGISGAFNGASEIAGGETNLTRSHFARFLVAEGHAKDNRQVFKRFLIKGRPGYARAEWIPMEDAIRVIHAAGGVAVMAHPARYSVSAKRLRCILSDFTQAGGDAMEVSCGGGNAAELQNLGRLADTFNLAASLGSDFHGPDKPWAQLGRLLPLPGHLRHVMEHLKQD